MGVLTGIRIVEIAAIGPVPWCGMLLADMGADIIRVDRADGAGAPRRKVDFTRRGRDTVAVDLKRPEGVQFVLRLVEQADALMEGMRPGVMERLGLGPEPCLAMNPRLVYGRMTGWGQEGPLAQTAGHDINYIALAGTLHAIGRKGEAPVPPLNLVGDYGGGGAYLAIGLLGALLESRASGRGQVVDVAMVDGVASLMAGPYGRFASGEWIDARGENLLDGGAPWYDVYETADGRYMAVGAVEAKFYQELVDTLGLGGEALPDRGDRGNWAHLRERFAQVFKTRTRDEWQRIFEPTDACVTPVLTMAEAPLHPHMAQRETYVTSSGVIEPNAAPRFSRTASAVSPEARTDAASVAEALRRWGVRDTTGARFEPREAA
jgi:alpha-methylacyl-CoA racemase